MMYLNHEVKAKYRMNYMWENNKLGMIKDYLYYKPKLMLYGSFYWKEVFSIPESFNIIIRKFDLLIAFALGLFALIKKKYWKEIVFLGSIYVSQILVYSYTFAYSRYSQTLYFLRFIIIGLGLQQVYEYIKNKKNRREL